MPMLARGYPMPSGGTRGPSGGGTFGTSTGKPTGPVWTPPRVPVPTPSNDNVRRVGKSAIPKIKIRGLVRGRFPIDLLLRGIAWYARQDGDYLPTDINTDGWTLECGSGQSGHLNRLGACPPGPQLQAAEDWDWGVVTISTTKTQVMNFFTNKGPPIDLGGTDYHWGDQTSRWSRTYSSPEQLATMPPAVIPPRPILPEVPVPQWMPAIDPEMIPIAQPTPIPQPIPHWYVPRHRPSPGHTPNRPARGPGPPPGSIPDDRFAVNPGKSFTWAYHPGRGRDQPKQIVRPGDWTPPRPPGKRTDEKKFALTINASNVGRVVGRIFGSATEVIDFIDSMYWSIPYEVKRANGIRRKSKYIGWDERAHIVWKLRDHIDWDKAFDNLMQNELEDRLIGTLGKGSGRLAKKTGSTHGFAIGPAL